MGIGSGTTGRLGLELAGMCGAGGGEGGGCELGSGIEI